MTPVEAASQFVRACPSGACLLVAISGGSDSTGLLLALHETLQKLGRTDIKLFAATIDHALRPGSDVEAQTVADLCFQLNIPHSIATWTGEKPATGIPAAARLARYRLLSTIAQQISATCIVTGHTLNDQEETVAMRAERSENDAPGLAGMASAMLFERKIWIARPFLSVSRSDIRHYLGDKKTGWIDDPTNENLAYERARVRKDLAKGMSSHRPVAPAALKRREQSEAVACFLKQHVTVYDQAVAVVDRASAAVDPAGLRALAVLVAIMGGRSHVPGRDPLLKLERALKAKGMATITLSRSAVTFRHDKIYIARETRDLPILHLAAGQSVEWDNRFLITNQSSCMLRVDGIPNVKRSELDALSVLPPVISNRARRSRANIRMIGDPQEDVSEAVSNPFATEILIEPIFPLFDHFLPIFDFAAANSVSQLFGRSGFPPFLVDYI